MKLKVKCVDCGTMNLDLPRIVDALLDISEWPWHMAGDDAKDCPAHKDSGLALADTGRSADWPIARLCEWNTARFIASSPVWLASLVVALVEERAEHYENLILAGKLYGLDCYKRTFVDFSLDPAKYAELKKRLEEKSHD